MNHTAKFRLRPSSRLTPVDLGGWLPPPSFSVYTFIYSSIQQTCITFGLQKHSVFTSPQPYSLSGICKLVCTLLTRLTWAHNSRSSKMWPLPAFQIIFLSLLLYAMHVETCSSHNTVCSFLLLSPLPELFFCLNDVPLLKITPNP